MTGIAWWARRLLPVLAAGLLVAACGSDIDEDAVAAARSSAIAAASAAATSSALAAAPAAIPTAGELDAKIKGALDPDLPDDARIALIQNGEAFRSSIPDLYRALREHPNAVYEVVDPIFDNHDGTLTATARLDKDGTGTGVRTANLHFVLVDGDWKISRVDLCGILRTADYHSQACG
ncbi:hypothetical protein OG921_22125 [Aldersonia sp. NBC_00410]|uniref:hypothetical protein n=1 Tax=Aldersonia sp. NBC_00410 TaxID=2975954 RepID=UPI00224D6AE6|nr:hypothetical protein [Aldersonia sp. NBC_00410]MCX5045870.1 hypothetical protein [Aldersonia sp. NBC_00410]